MPERWVLNASPIISLARVDRANLLFSIPDEVVVPQAVFDEVMAGPATDAARVFLQSKESVIVTSESSSEITPWDLGRGETAVLSFALANPNYVAVLDDAAARKCANSFSIPVKGTLAVVLLAKQKNLIPSAADVLRSLRSAGFHLDDRVIQKALKDVAGESWG
ncbi:MAG TPA: DUF3368 domain-containing protein [Anaerolineales bacterium]|nr:DUF3368 domain-containing protein [Anaerolineales bacterium]